MNQAKKQSAIAVIIFIMIAGAGVLMYFRAASKLQKPPSAGLTANDANAVEHLYGLLEQAEKTGVSDPAGGIAKAKEAIAAIEKLDGVKFESGGTFRKESIPLLKAYLSLAGFYDDLEDCDSAKQYALKMEEGIKQKYIIIPLHLVGPLTLMYGDEQYYVSAKKRSDDMLLRSLEDALVNCTN